ncbi:carbohydrate binding domain-containing protein [Micromonospora parastrephiae]|uniref:carbohydrate binding domain-containing protein n=1 Tax=Micromonospora parastrephiae TaxID=2806101 RepID=UPI0028166773|nr:carbohydrate binding domain-containing protein [Micromonospora parastrephiae]
MEQPQRRATRGRVAAIASVGVLLAAGIVAGAAPVQAAETDLVVNGGFEQGTANWFVNNGNASDSAALSVTSDAYSGSSAALVTNRTTTGSGPMQDLSGKVQAGQTYVLTARIKYENPSGPATKQFFATMHYGAATYTNLVSVTATKGQWAQFNGTFTIPAEQNVSTARLFFETPWTSTPSTDPDLHLMDFTLDDVSVVGAAPPAARRRPSRSSASCRGSTTR